MNYVSRLKQKYYDDVIPTLIKKFTYTSKMAVPCLKKIVVNIGVGDAINNRKFLDDSMRELELITGQHPIVTYAKKSIATFKLRAGQAIGCKVTLRKNKMYDFFDKLINVVLPRVRDFRGLSLKSFDGNGNYSIGIKEQIIFPEINYDQVFKVRGMDIVIVTTANTDDEAKELLAGFGVPFSNK